MEIGDSINHKDPDIITPNFDLAKTSRWCCKFPSNIEDNLVF